ncbi:MAG: hypothetical protein ACI82S_002119 [Patiriisocius sp.]|jgi:hypothetical protein
MKLFSKALAIPAVAVMMIIPTLASATCSGASCTGEITRLYINGAGTLYIRLNATDIPAETSCSLGTNYGTLTSDNPAFKNFFAMALTAQALGASTTLRVVDNSPSCEIQYITLNTPTT